jgi:hypothetical protein
MYISNDGILSINIDELNVTTNDDITWNRGYQDEDVLKIQFDIKNRLENYTLDRTFQQLQNEIEDKTEFSLTGVEYNIEKHSGELVFSSVRNIETNTNVGELLSQNPDSLTVPKTLAYENTVTCTGAFVAFFDWGYRAKQIKLDQEDGMYITALPSDKQIPSEPEI